MKKDQKTQSYHRRGRCRVVKFLQGARIVRDGERVWLEANGRREELHGGFYATAHVQDFGSQHYKIRISYPSVRGSRAYADLPKSLVTNPRALKSELVDRGLNIAISAKASNFAKCVEVLQHYEPRQLIQKIADIGWNQPDGDRRRLVFVLGDEVLGAPRERHIRLVSNLRSAEFGARGTVRQWRRAIGRLCRRNSYLILAVASAFAAPLLRLCNMEPDGVHLVGASTTGKTTILVVLGSVYGDPSCYGVSWLMTDNAPEALGARFNDLPLAVDEIGQAHVAKFGQSVYALFNGTGRSRAKMNGEAQAVRRFRNKVFSTGEMDVKAHMAQAGQGLLEGQDIRMLCCPVNWKYGAFQNIHGEASPARFAQRLSSMARRHHGSVGRAFLEYVVAKQKRVERLLVEKLPIYQRHLERAGEAYGLTSAEKRVARRLALVAFAGELATKRKLTGWKAGDAETAVAQCFGKWLAYRREANKAELAALTAPIRTFIKNNAEGFVKLSLADKQGSQPLGYRYTLKGVRVYLITTARFQEICGADYKRCLQTLRSAGALVHSKRLDTQMRVPGLKKRPVFYAIRRKFITQ